MYHLFVPEQERCQVTTPHSALFDMENPWDGSKWHADECRMTAPPAEILAAAAASLDVVQRRRAVQAFGVRRGLRCLRQAHRLRERRQIWVHAARATAPHADRVACARRLAGQVAAAATALRVAVVTLK